MRHLVATLVLLVLAGTVRAQERIPDDEAREIAKVLAEAAKKVKAPFETEVNPEKPYGKRKDQYGGMFLPDRKLSAERLSKLGKDEIIPVGQFWLRHLTLVVNDKAVPSSKLQLVTITYKDQEHTLPLFFAGVGKGDKGPELRLFTKGKTPILKLPLTKGEEKQELPIEFLSSVEGNERVVLTLKLLGRYSTRLTLTPLRD